jgi:IS5 family transposase
MNNTKLDALERIEEEGERKLAHVQRLLTALAPDPSMWEYRGELLEGDDSSKCACGHKIRLLFPVYRGEKEVRILGSVCIEHYSAINPAVAARMIETLERHRAAVAEAEKKAKEAASAKEVEAARNEHQAAYDRAHALADSFPKYSIPEPLFWATRTSRRVPSPSWCPRYTRASAAVKWHKKHTAALLAALKV